MRFSELTQKRFKAFWKLKRARFALLLLLAAYIMSLAAPLWISDKPLYVNYKDESFFPVFSFYSDQDFGGQYKTEMNYVELRKRRGTSEDISMILPLVPHSPLHAYLDREGQPPYAPSADHWLGTDNQGRDMLARLVYGFRICMSFSLLTTLISMFFGVVLGGLQGYIGSKFDLLGQRLVEIWSALPFLYVVILVSVLIGRSFWILIGVLSLFSWIGLSQYMRAEFIRLRNFQFVKAAKAMGMSHRHIFFKEILPNGLTPLITIAPFAIIGGIGSLTALDYLGFGLQPPTPSWGELISQGLQNIYAWWVSGFTILALFMTLLLTTFVGEGVRDAFDPKGGDQ